MKFLHFILVLVGLLAGLSGHGARAEVREEVQRMLHERPAAWSSSARVDSSD